MVYKNFVLYSNTNLKSKFYSFISDLVKNNSFQPVLEIVQFGDDPASTRYIQIKSKIGEKLGIKINLRHLDDNSSADEVVKLIHTIEQKNVGMIFQLPVPKKFESFVRKTRIKNDVDLLGENSFKLWSKDFLPPTIGAIDLVLKDIFENLSAETDFANFILSRISLKSKVVAVIGQGILVGNPLLRYFKERQATILSLNSSTPHPQEICKLADIVICAAGSPKLVDKNWLNPQAIVIDASTSEAEGHLVGDVNPENLHQTNLLCPSPGGIGRITVLYLFYNLLKLQKLNFEQKKRV